MSQSRKPRWRLGPVWKANSLALALALFSAVTLLALTWTGMAFCAPQGRLGVPYNYPHDVHGKCGNWQDDMSKATAACVVRDFLSYEYHLPHDKSEEESWKRHVGLQYKPKDKPFPYKDLVSSDENGYTFALKLLIVDSRRVMYSNLPSKEEIVGAYHFEDGGKVHVAFADVTGIRTTGGTQWGGSDIHLSGATGDLDTFYVSRGQRRDVLLALHTLCPNAKFTGKYSK